MDWENAPIDDLRLLKTERRFNDEGEEYFIIFSIERDAVTTISASDVELLRKRGLEEIEELPE